MSTEAEKTGKAAENGSQTTCGRADEVAALTARLAAVEAERAAQDGRWRALVGELTEWCDILLTLTDATAPIVEATYGQADPAGWVAQRETVACIRARLRQRLAALPDAPPARRGAAE